MLEEREGAVLIRETGHDVVRPDDGHVARPGAIGRLDHTPREVRALDGSLENELLALAQGDPLPHEQGGIKVELTGEGLGRDAALLVGHGQR